VTADTRLRRRLTIAALVACAAARAAPAQQPVEVADGFRDSARVAWSDARTRCATTLRTGFVIAAADSSCRVVSLVPLGRAGDDDWYVARYRRAVTLADSFATDTMDLDELVLFAHAPDASDARLAWHLVRDRDYEFLDTLRWVPTSHDLFLSLLICLNGTGGCTEEYLRFDGGRWRTIAQPFARDLQSRLPADHWLHKGRRLNLETLTGVWPVAAPGDGNCCPSLELPFSLRLVNDALILLDAGPLRATPDR
jgi:hypothetical protein